MKKFLAGFTLIEVVIFIIVTGIIVGTILRASSTGLLGSSSSSQQIMANNIAQQCMDYMLGNRRLNGYTVYSCPSTPGGSLCTTIAGYTLSNSVTCTTLSGNSNFKTLTVNVTGNATATLNTLIANY
jgi:Tfp pilus assembly protein PilV